MSHKFNKKAMELSSRKIILIVLMTFVIFIVLASIPGNILDPVKDGVFEIKNSGCETNPDKSSCQIKNCIINVCSEEEQEIWDQAVKELGSKDCNEKDCNYIEEQVFNELNKEELSSQEIQETTQQNIEFVRENKEVFTLDIRDTSFDLDANIDKMPKSVRETYERLEEIDSLFSDSAKDVMVAESIQKGLNPALALVVITQESLGDPNAVSYTGCVGLMQFCYTTALDYPNIFDLDNVYEACHTKDLCDEDDRTDPYKSIKAGIKKLDGDSRNLDNNLVLTLVAYNAGAGIAARCEEFSQEDPEELIGCVEREVSSHYGNGVKLAEVSKYFRTISSNYEELIS